MRLLSNTSEKLLPVRPGTSLFPLPRVLLLEAEFLPQAPVPDEFGSNSLLDLNSSGNACGRGIGLGRPVLLGQNLPRGSGCLRVAL